MKAVYVGAGLDTNPYQILSKIKNWIAIDSLPRSAFGYIDGPIMDPNFVSNLDKKMELANFKLEELNNNIRIYYNNLTNQTVRFHINTSLPNDFNSKESQVFLDTKDWNVLFVAGHEPHPCIMKTSIDSKLIFIGMKNSYYVPNPCNPDSICYSIHHQINSTDKFKLFEYINDDTIYSFDNWQDFLKKSIESIESNCS